MSMADEKTRTPVSDEEQPDAPEAETEDHEPIDLPNRQAMSLFGPGVLYPDVDPLGTGDPSSGHTTPGGVPTE
jgi:hypothetical protein